jgi:translation initiation factor IF-2
MIDDRGRRLTEAGPAIPVEVQGLSGVPQAGDELIVLADEKQAREIAGKRQSLQRTREMEQKQRVSLDDLFNRMREGELKELNLVVKADVQGSVEALEQALEKIDQQDVRLRVLHGGVGAIVESDIMLASASDAIVIGFNVRPDAGARQAAEREKVDVRTYRVIYEALDDITAALKGMLEPTWHEVEQGRADVRATFKVPKVGVVAGCYITEGKVTSRSQVRVIRDGVVLHEGPLISLKRFKDDVREVNAGYECGIGVDRFNDIKEGDTLEFFVMERVQPE